MCFRTLRKEHSPVRHWTWREPEGGEAVDISKSNIRNVIKSIGNI